MSNKSKSSAAKAAQRETDVALVGNLAKDALDPKRGASREQIEEQLAELNPEQAAMFVRVLEITLKRRRIQLLGYICALLSVVVGMFVAIYLWGTRTPGTFIGWVFIIPPAAAGLCIWLFGRWSNRVR